jgi:tRNA threonylcarbamoyladenosine biosynthesis protein TsaE
MPETVSVQRFTYGIGSIPKITKTLKDYAGEEKVWIFYGDLGAGKTTLIKEICTQLGVDKNQLSSPTFSIINEYSSSSGLVYHFDFYRLKNEAEILDLGIEEYFDSGNYCFVEWPERLGSLLPSTFLKIAITHLSATERIIEYEKYA